MCHKLNCHDVCSRSRSHSYRTFSFLNERKMKMKWKKETKWAEMLLKVAWDEEKNRKTSCDLCAIRCERFFALLGRVQKRFSRGKKKHSKWVVWMNRGTLFNTHELVSSGCRLFALSAHITGQQTRSLWQWMNFSCEKHQSVPKPLAVTVSASSTWRKAKSCVHDHKYNSASAKKKRPHKKAATSLHFSR